MCKRDDGLYTLEAALAITVFTSLFMILLSLISLIRVETVIQSALNQTAMQLSQYSYAVVRLNEVLLAKDEISVSSNPEEGDIGASIYKIVKEMQCEAKGYAGGAVLCEALTRDNFDSDNIDSWLEKQGITDGYESLSFIGSNVLGDGENIEVVVTYKMKVNTFGLFEKYIPVCQRAVTRAWLPPDAGEILGLTEESTGKSIWNETTFVRGKYFVQKLKKAEPTAAVEAGQGVDLYYKSDRIIAEIFSMNVFNASYSKSLAENEDERKDVQKYKANDEYITKQLISYARDFNFDILKTERLIEMADGSLGNFGRLNEKRLILIVPSEAAQNSSFTNAFEEAGNVLLRDHGITLVVKYMEEALI